MLLMGNIIGGILLIVVGTLILYFHNQLYSMFGNIEWAEQYLGDSKSVYILFGFFVIVVGVLVIAGMGTGSPARVGAGVQSTGFGK